MARNTALYWLSRSLRVMSVPTATPHWKFTPMRRISSTSRRTTSLRQAVFGQGVAQHAAGLGIGFVDRDLVAQQRQVERGGEAGGPGADHRHLAVGGRQFARRDALRQGVEAVGLVDGIGDEAVHLAHVDRLHPPSAGGSGCRRDAGRRGRWRRAAGCPAPPPRRLPPCALPYRAGGSAGCSCAAGNCSRRARAPGPRTRRRGSAWRGCGPRTRGGSAAWWSAAGWARVWPRPHSEVSRIMRPISSRRSRSVSVARAARERVQDAQRLVEAHAAGNALAAGFRVGELDEVAGHVHHAVVFVHHHHAARAHDGAELRERLVVHRRIEHLLRDAAARGAAGLHGLDVLAVACRLRRRRR